MIRWLRRLALAVLIGLIVIATPCAFWVFTLGRVALNPETYKDVLHDAASYADLYKDLLPALADGATRNIGDASTRTALIQVIDAMPAGGWTVVSDKLPPSWLQDQLDGDMAHFFSWLNGTRSTLAVAFDLQALKTALGADKAQAVASAVLPTLLSCSAAQEQKISDSMNNPIPAGLPLCYPSKANTRTTMTGYLAAQLTALATQLPARLDLTVQLRRAEIGSTGQHLSDFDIEQAQSVAALTLRLLGLLLLLPVALLCLIVMVSIRSWKSFFRWTAWILVVSSLIAAVLVPILPALMTGAYATSRSNLEKWFGSGGRLVGSLLNGIIGSVAAGLMTPALIQISVTLAAGFIALVISILLTGPAPDVLPSDRAAERFPVSGGSGWTPGLAATKPRLINASSDTPSPRGTSTSKKIGGSP